MINKIDPAKIDVSIRMIKTYVTEVDTSAVIDALEALKKPSDDVTLIDRLSESLDPLGIAKGAILTYAPYLAVIISDDPFKDV